MELVAASIGDGYNPIGHGDYAGYATPALDLYQLTEDTGLREKLLRTVDGPFTFAEHDINGTPANSPPFDGWWVSGGYGTRYWVDDFYTMVVWLSELSSTRNGLPGNRKAGYLARKFIRDYVNVLWNPEVGLFWHDQSQVGSSNYWARGEGWAGYGLSRAADFLEGKDRDDIHELLAKMAAALILLQAEDGGWSSYLGDSLACERKSETSGTGMITFMLEHEVKQGWLDRETFMPAIRKALRFLLSTVDENGDVSGIQPPGTGPGCDVVISSDAGVNANYGSGAMIFALSGALEFSDEDLSPRERPRKENPREILSF